MIRLICRFALLSIISAIYAEEEIVTELPPTVVTGDLWKSQLQQTTASVTVLDGERLKYSGSQHFSDLINTIPNIRIIIFN